MARKYNMAEQKFDLNVFQDYQQKKVTRRFGRNFSFTEIDFFYKHVLYQSTNGNIKNTNWKISWWQTCLELTHFSKKPKLDSDQTAVFNKYCEFVWQKVLQFDKHFLVYLE